MRGGVLELAPLADGAQHEHGDDAHPTGGDDRAEEDPESERKAAIAVALQPHQAVADEPAGDAAEADRREGGSAGGRGRQCRQWSVACVIHRGRS